MWDWLTGFANFLGALGGLVGPSIQIAGLFKDSPAPAPAPAPWAPPPMPQYEVPEIPMFEIYIPPTPTVPLTPTPTSYPTTSPELLAAQRKSMLTAAARARQNLQGRGVYSGGAVTPESLASLLAVDDPDAFYEAWKTEGDKYGLPAFTA